MNDNNNKENNIKPQSTVQFECHRVGRNGTVVLTAMQDGEVLAVDELCITKSRARETFTRRLCERCPGLDAATLETELERLAARHVAQSAETKAPDKVSGQTLLLQWPEPWPEPLSLAEVLNEVRAAIHRHVILSSDATTAVALWIAWTYVYDSGRVAPMLAITSPSKRCGKTRLLSVLRHLVARALPASNCTPSSIFRVIEQYGPLTLLIDEADSFAPGDEILRGVVNSGHTRDMAFVLRTVPLPDGTHEVRRFSTWCCKALAAIGNLPGTWADRSIAIQMARKLHDEEVERLTPQAIERLETLSRKLFSTATTDEVKAAVATGNPAIPQGLNDRAADNWTPLLAIADCAGGDWPTSARRAALALAGTDVEGEDIAVRLLVDVYRVFEQDDELPAKLIAERLAKLDESPWPTYARGKPILPQQVGAKLRSFGVKPHITNTHNCYRRADVRAVAERYAPTPPVQASTASTPDVTPCDAGTYESGGSKIASLHQPPPASTASTASTAPVRAASDNGGNGQEKAESTDDSEPVSTPSGQPTTLKCGTTIEGQYTLIRTSADLDAAVADLARYPILGVDTETTGLDPHSDRLRLIQLSTPDRHTYVIDCAAVDPRPLVPVLERATLVGHHLTFDLRFLAAAGFPWGSIDSCNDVMLAGIIADGVGPAKGRHTLQALAKRFLGADLPKEQQRSDWSRELSSEQIAYAANDAAILLPLRDAIDAALRRDSLVDTAELEFRCLPAMAWMEDAGLLIDREAWIKLAEQQKAEAERLQNELNATTSEPVKWSSQKQVIDWLRGFGIEVESTSIDVLLEHADKCPHIRTLLDYRKASKLASTYGLAFLDHVHSVTHRIHPDWHQIGAKTGRMSCSDPNLQNLPRRKEYRQCIIPAPGHTLVASDFSQIELRVAGALSRDRRLLEAYHTGVDVHRQTASMVLGVPEETITKEDRQLAKALNFGLLYGCGAKTLRKTLFVDYGIAMPLEQAEELRREFFRVYDGLYRWQRSEGNSQRSFVRLRSGRVVRDVERYTQKCNFQVQGLAGDGLKHAVALLWETRDTCPSARLVAAVHDELLVEVAEDEAERAKEWVQRCMLDGMRRVVSGVEIEVEAKVCRTWAEK